jgi:hypothetical protein
MIAVRYNVVIRVNSRLQRPYGPLALSAAVPRVWSYLPLAPARGCRPGQLQQVAAPGGQNRVREIISRHTSPGVFLEIGALDGVKYSNTYGLEHAFGCKGILVEAQPSNGAALRKADRPRAAIFTSAACQISGLTSPSRVRFSTEGGAVATDLDHAAPSFLKIWGGAHGEGYVSVPCVPSQYFIDATGLWDIDFFSLDVKGGEKVVLETVNLAQTNIRVLMVELDGHDPEKDEWVRAHLQQAGFENLGGEFMINKNNEVFLNPATTSPFIAVQTRQLRRPMDFVIKIDNPARTRRSSNICIPVCSV